MAESDTDLLDELDLGSPDDLRLRGALRRADFVEYTRDLDEGDLIALSQPRGVKPPALQRIHSSHHSLARCLATGMRDAQAGLVTGYSVSRIAVLKADPAFQALVADYKAEAKAIFADLAERMADISLDAIEILHERLHNDPTAFSIPLLLDVVKAFADRTGHGPGSEVRITETRNFIDRPPRETFEDWERRRTIELSPKEVKKLN
jgi:hypothetical protein